MPEARMLCDLKGGNGGQGIMVSRRLFAVPKQTRLSYTVVWPKAAAENSRQKDTGGLLNNISSQASVLCLCQAKRNVVEKDRYLGGED